MREPTKGEILPISDIDSLIVMKDVYDKDTGELIINEKRIKFIGGLEYLDWVLIATYTEIEDDRKISGSVEVNITRL